MAIKYFLLSSSKAYAAGLFGSLLSSTEPPRANDLSSFLIVVKDFAFGIAGAVAFAMIIWGISLLFLSGGDQSKVTKAKQVLTAAIVGLSIIITAAYITGTFVNVLSGAS